MRGLLYYICMQFQVPQFIEVEDKIIGPFTFKQFVFMAGGLGMTYVLWRLLPFFLAIPLIVGVIALAAALAFFQVNGRPFILALENGFYYFLHPKLYLWNNVTKKKAVVRQEAVTKTAEVYIPKLTDSRLHELAWSLDIKERVAAGTAAEEEREDTQRGNVAPMRTAQDVLSSIRERTIQ
ncbi:MAG: seg [Candidatus Kaiserbacteria bacterium]|nr:seg [Candidatus Kaiserbacteria bacterium]